MQSIMLRREMVYCHFVGGCDRKHRFYLFIVKRFTNVVNVAAILVHEISFLCDTAGVYRGEIFESVLFLWDLWRTRDKVARIK